MKKQTFEFMFFRNGSTIVFDEKGNQVNCLQKNWFKLYKEFLEKEGYIVTNIVKDTNTSLYIMYCDLEKKKENY